MSVRAQILNLLEDLRSSFHLTLVLVSHDLSVVRHMCDRVLVMSRGEVVEAGNTRQIFQAPRHPYTRLLLDSIPRLRMTPPKLEDQLARAGDGDQTSPSEARNTSTSGA